MLKAGIVGFGFMGQMHYRCLRNLEGVQVAAVCDSNPDIDKIAGSVKGNIEGNQGAVDFSEFELFQDFDTMLEKADLDIISITLPTYLHKAFTVKALEHGINVFCEKPMALDVDECSEMISAARKSGKELMVGHCIRFWPEYVKAKEIIDSGKYGKVISAVFQRLGSPPNWGDSWFKNEKQSGGMALDLHIHDTDYIQYLFGLPKSVLSSSAANSNGLMTYISTRYEYEDGKLVIADGSWAMTASFGFQMSFNIAMETAVLVFDCTRDPALRLCPADGEAYSPEVAEGDGYSRELKYFIDKVNGKPTEDIITDEQSARSVQIIKAELESAKTANKVIIK
ncbi:putative oxidoreductase YcjS [Limihaloglobus sulfuriphilus]|uniref:Putative oxidoreductase YcjS n=1 Tax=Limihaloglobus sulfuriphilus TaxID=1851148 RepID=A0A1Q2MCI7_9BACT|nr:Gfo/Idh/MocA family oxidoreductase [Limihaloglobus sulfuriphilus]AQQ70017.1 putative oxidoreductase YcjS [Limihaloglobus sulfuriphilus]